jgi:hypothetical protein
VKAERNLSQNAFSTTATETAKETKLTSISAQRQDNMTARNAEKKAIFFTLAKHLGDTGPKTKKTNDFQCGAGGEMSSSTSTPHQRVSAQARAF